MSFSVTNIKTEYLVNPIGLDCPKPRFSWQMKSEDRGMVQHSYRITVTSDDGIIMWDSGMQEKGRSDSVFYDGEDLKPCTRYIVRVYVLSGNGEEQEAESYFETGFMDETMGPWEDVKWIGSSDCGLAALAKGVFSIKSTFTVIKGTNAGIVFGANDPRLTDKYKNIYLIEGRNYIAYTIDISTIPAKLKIYRVGYSPEDKEDVPFFIKEIYDLQNPEDIIITEENKRDEHTLYVEVLGNQAKAYIDEKLVDEVIFEPPFAPGTQLHVGRQLNPIGNNDVITFPLLNEIGFYGADSKAVYKNLVVSNIREPKAELFRADKEHKGSFSSLTVHNEIVTVDPSSGSIPLLHREIDLEGNNRIKKARLYATAHGIYECRINNIPISEDWFQPGASQYDKHLYYQTYDITELLKLNDGSAAIDFTLASGWWSDSQTFSVPNHNYFGDRPALLAKIVIEYEDGTVQTVATDDKWQCSMDGPIRYASFFHGQHIDARRKPESWEKAVEIKAVPVKDEMDGFHRWPTVNLTEPKFIGQIDRPVMAVNELTAVSRTEIRPGIFLYDMGQNMVGVPKIMFHEKAGKHITIRFCETCYPKLPEYGELHGLPLMENLRDASCTDIYVCAGNEEGELFAPRLTFHGYRYVEITCVENPPEVSEVKGVVLTSAAEITGSFKCSDDMVNRFWENVLWSQRGNFLSIPTDCPQRNERMGWMGDAQVFAQTALYQADVRTLYYRYLQAVRDVQADNGRFADIAPIGGGFGGIIWGSAGIIIPYEIYRQLGDIALLQEMYPAMKKYINYLEAGYAEGVLAEGVGNLGDWLAADMSTDNNLVWSAYFAYDIKLMSEISETLGIAGEAERYKALFEKTKLDWNERFVNSEGITLTVDGKINDTQCSYAVPLYFGIASEENRFKMAERLDSKTKELGYTLTTGFVGTAPINQVLSAYGYNESAYKLMMQTEYPSWLYSVTQGATTIWERWNSFTLENGFSGNNSMNSFNHYSLGAVSAWLYRWVLGIQPGDKGFQNFILRPAITVMENASGHYDSPYGAIESSWVRNEDYVNWKVRIPPNTSAKVYLQGERVMLDGVYVKDIQTETDRITLSTVYYINLNAGSYTFRWQEKK